MNTRPPSPKSAFIPNWLDDLGLTPKQFRVYCHIARRGKCWESLASFSKCCRMDREAVQAELKMLETMRLITKKEHFGQPSTYAVTQRRIPLPTQRRIPLGNLAENSATPSGEFRYKGSSLKADDATTKPNDDVPF